MCFSAEVERDVEALRKRLGGSVSQEDETRLLGFAQRGRDRDFLKSALNLPRKPTTEFFKFPREDRRIFPGYFSWVLLQENGLRTWKQMRYRIRPAGSAQEIPAKFNVFNARLDSLERRQTWNPLFTRRHGLFPFTRFFEWVEFQGQKRLISFAPEDRELMWAPCLWDYWENPGKDFGFYSFALITDDPPEEVSRMGHDRCPVFLREDLIDDWLSCGRRSTADFYDILKRRETVTFSNQWAA